MENSLLENELLKYSSTYAVLTADRILARFGLHLSADELAAVMENKDSVFFQILLVPFKNVINGIVFQQAYDYQIYAQKLFVDYLVSGSGNDSSETPGENTRQDLEENRTKLIQLGEQFDKDSFAHKTLINKSQGELLKLVREIKPFQDTRETAVLIAQSMAPLNDQATELGQALRNYRVEFKTLILDTVRLVQLLPDYRENDTQKENLELLSFDDQLG
jgi:hypothetical protein